jgi:hypothetical protein
MRFLRLSFFFCFISKYIPTHRRIHSLMPIIHSLRLFIMYTEERMRRMGNTSLVKAIISGISSSFFFCFFRFLKHNCTFIYQTDSTTLYIRYINHFLLIFQIPSRVSLRINPSHYIHIYTYRID